MQLVVQKYGGTSVGTLERLKIVAGHIAATVRNRSQVVAVVSAMGKQTDDLLALAHQLSPSPPRREIDMLLTAGERISMALLSIALQDLGVPSISLTGSQCGILTDEVHGNARIRSVLGDRIRRGLKEGYVVIAAGFQGMSPKTKDITTLGRGGTDLSAIAIAAALAATKCELYKDVNAIMTADPRHIKEAMPRQHLSWDQMSELAWAGAGVLHPRGAHLAAKFGLELEIRSSFNLEIPGTIVGGAVESIGVVALAHKTGMAILNIQFSLAASENGLSAISASLAWLWEQGESPQVLQQRQIPGSRMETILVIAAKFADGLISQVRKSCSSLVDDLQIEFQTDLATITVVGDGFWQNPEAVAAISIALRPPPMIFEVKNSAVTICVPEKDLHANLSRLHQNVIKETN